MRRRVRRRLRLRPEARFVFSVMAFFALAVLLITRHALLYGLGHELEARRDRLERLRAEHQDLLVQVASLESPERIEREARQAGYVEPASVRMVRAGVPAGAIAGAPGPAEPPRSAVVALTPGGGTPVTGASAAPTGGGGWWRELVDAVREGWSRWTAAGSHVAGR